MTRRGKALVIIGKAVVFLLGMAQQGAGVGNAYRQAGAHRRAVEDMIKELEA